MSILMYHVSSICNTGDILSPETKFMIDSKMEFVKELLKGNVEFIKFYSDREDSIYKKLGWRLSKMKCEAIFEVYRIKNHPNLPSRLTATYLHDNLELAQIFKKTIQGTRR